MPKTITSPVPEFPGTLTLCEPLNLAQCYAVSNAFETMQENAKDKKSRASGKVLARSRDILEALIACAEKWEIAGQPEKPTQDTFVASPVGAANDLLTWAFNELQQIYFGETTVPNA